MACTTTSAFSAYGGGSNAATYNPTNPDQLYPITATSPLHHAYLLAHSTTSAVSYVCSYVYSSVHIPSESPLPRVSTLTHPNPWPAKYGYVSSSISTIPSDFR